MQPRISLFIIVCITITIFCLSVSVHAGSRKVLNSTVIVHKSGPDRIGPSSRFDGDFLDDDFDISKEEKNSEDDENTKPNSKKENIKINKNKDQNAQGDTATARSCTGGGSGSGSNPISTPDLSALTSLIGPASGIIEVVVAIIVILAIIWIKIIAIGIIWYFWVGGKGDKDSGYGYSSQPVYGPPQSQYGAPASAYGKSLSNSFNLDTIGNYVWKAVDFFTEMNASNNNIKEIESKKN